MDDESLEDEQVQPTKVLPNESSFAETTVGDEEQAQLIGEGLSPPDDAFVSVRTNRYSQLKYYPMNLHLLKQPLVMRNKLSLLEKVYRLQMMLSFL